MLVIGDRLCDDDGAAVGSQGFYVDLSDFGDETSIDAAIAGFTAHRALIEQAKGILMMTYGISAEQAFDILVWRSQETNVKLRTLVLQIIEDFTTRIHVPREVRERADHLVLTAHRRLHTAASPLDAASDAC
ncbi:ANTAR domain-containing protein [Mycobacterium sp.]|uniref:ANTAR domain-containing protein n=1 Tax=Mycobacterium sp. TaxID=1785 RepID=UPI002DACAEA5|nr:ANTAR domain-containing protein [Mycobacterium sp.]